LREKSSKNLTRQVFIKQISIFFLTEQARLLTIIIVYQP